MHTTTSAFTGRERRRHFRVVGRWPVRITAVELSGAVAELDAEALNISMGGLLLETDERVALWVDKVVQISFPGAGGAVPGSVRRFLSYGEDGAQTTRWGVELAELSVPEQAMWTRFLFGEARRLGQEGAHRAFLARRSL
jgi:PilZ domain-containing protein